MYSTGLNSRKLASKFRLVIHNNSLWTLLKLDRGGGRGREGGGRGSGQITVEIVEIM